MLLTARTRAGGLAGRHPRSRSRLRALPVVALAAPDDALLRALIVKLAADRQLAVDEALVNYLANRIERSFAAARAAVARLDEEAHAPAPAGDAGAGGRTVPRQRLTARLDVARQAVRARTVIAAVIFGG